MMCSIGGNFGSSSSKTPCMFDTTGIQGWMRERIQKSFIREMNSYIEIIEGMERSKDGIGRVTKVPEFSAMKAFVAEYKPFFFERKPEFESKSKSGFNPTVFSSNRSAESPSPYKNSGFFQGVFYSQVREKIAVIEEYVNGPAAKIPGPEVGQSIEMKSITARGTQPA